MTSDGKQGLRDIALAYRELPSTDPITIENDEQHLTLHKCISIPQGASQGMTARSLWGLTRLELFLDKLFGLSHETTATHAWMNEGSQ